jgi:hypothetical protein
MSLGGVGAPCGKDDTACAWLIGILDIGWEVLIAPMRIMCSLEQIVLRIVYLRAKTKFII